MKCKSCEQEISQKFAHSLKTNICPFCGETIMDEDLVVALSELRDVMELTKEWKSEMLEWLKTNYNLIDASSEEYQALVEKAKSIPAKIKVDPKEVQLDTKGNQITGTPIQSQETTNVFMKRAQVPGAKNPEYYKSMANKINKGSTSFSEADFAAADQEDVQAYQELMAGDASMPVQSTSAFIDQGDEEPLPSIIEAQAQGTFGATSSSYNARDVQKLQQLQNKVKGASKELSEGGGVGLIRRS